MTADLIISQLLFLDAEDSKKDIKLFINSPGGSVTAGMPESLFTMLYFLLLALRLFLLYVFLFLFVNSAGFALVGVHSCIRQLNLEK